MAAEEERRLRRLLVHAGDEGAALFARDAEKLLVAALPVLAQGPDPFTRLFALCATLQPGKAAFHAHVLCRLQGDHPAVVEGLLDALFAALREALATGAHLPACNVLALLGECARCELLNAFSFISVLMELLGHVERCAGEAAAALAVLLYALAESRDFLLQRYPMEFRNLVEDLAKVFDAVDPHRTGFGGRLFAAVSELSPAAPAAPLLTGRALRKSYELGALVLPAQQPPLLLFAQLCAGGDGLVALPELVFAERLRLLALAFAPNPQLLLEKLLAAEGPVEPALRQRLCCDLLLALCAEELPQAKFSGFVAVERALAVVEGFGAALAERAPRFEQCLEAQLPRFSLAQMGFLAFNVAQLRLRAPELVLFCARPAGEPLAFLLRAVEAELRSLGGEETPVPVEAAPELLFLHEALDAFFASALPVKDFEQFLAAHAFAQISADTLSAEVLAAFRRAALRSAAHFRAQLTVRGEVLAVHLRGREKDFLSALLTEAGSRPHTLKSCLAALSETKLVTAEQLVLICLEALRGERPGGSASVTEFLLRTPALTTALQEQLAVQPSGPLRDKLLEGLSVVSVAKPSIPLAVAH